MAEPREQSGAARPGGLGAERGAPAGVGQRALDRDMEVHRLTARLRTLRRFGLDLCLGRMVGTTDSDSDSDSDSDPDPDPDPDPVYVGRLGLTDRKGRRLPGDWRSPP